MEPRRRPRWYDPKPALRHAGLADNPAGRRKYLEYLAWLAEDEPAQKRQRFDELSRGLIVGGEGFVKALVQEHRELTGQGPRLAKELQAAREALWMDALRLLLKKLRHSMDELPTAGKSVPWKLAIAAGLKSRTTVTNRWLGQNLCMGNLHEVSRKIAAWTRGPDPALLRKIT